MTAPELATLIGAIGGILGIILKMWQDHTKLANKVADAFKENAVTQTKLVDAVDTNTKVTEANIRTTDNFSKLIEEMVFKTKRKKK